MRAKQSLSTIKNFMGNASRTVCNDTLYEALNVAAQSLEKQIPKKPVVKLDKYTGLIRSFYCPICGRFFGQAGIHNVILFNKERFCQGEGCGQAIDWSEDESEEE